MVARARVPQLSDPNIVIRLAQNPQEVEAANRLVTNNYIERGFWDDDTPLKSNKFLHGGRRHTFVAVRNGEVIGTASTVLDSHDEGLPADKFHSEVMTHLRKTGDKMAEVTAVAVDKSIDRQRGLVLFLFKYLYQYCFYYLSLDRFVIIVTKNHSLFYEGVCCFEKLRPASRYSYVKLEVELLSLQLLQAHRQFSDRYEVDGTRTNFYRFMLVDEHPNLLFPDKSMMRRSRNINWVAEASVKELAIAV